jgi:hypothetical protein
MMKTECSHEKRKKKNRCQAENVAGTDMDNSFVEETNRLKTHLFSQGPEDAQDACANTEVSNNMDALGNMSTREATMGRDWCQMRKNGNICSWMI